MTDQNKQLPTQGEWSICNVTLYRGEEMIQDDAGCYIAGVSQQAVKGEAEANAQAICKAVNNTYGKGINPEAVPYLLQAFKDVRSQLIDCDQWTKDSVFIKAIDLALEKAEL